MSYKIVWDRVDGAIDYNIYSSTSPAGEYSQIGLVSQVMDTSLSTYLRPEYEISYSLEVRNATAQQVTDHIEVSWDEPLQGIPYTYKIDQSTTDEAWFNNNLPPGSILSGFTWDTDRFFVGDRSISILEGTTGSVALLPSLSARYVVVWVYLDPVNSPDSIWIDLYDTTWTHRIYWGSDAASGLHGTKEKMYGGGLPNLGCWTPLTFHMSDVGANNIISISFGTHSQAGESIMNVGACVHSLERIYVAEYPHIPANIYEVSRTGLSVTTVATTYADYLAVDTGSIFSNPTFIFTPYDSENGQATLISWKAAEGSGTSYTYTIKTLNLNMEYSTGVETIGTISLAQDHVMIYTSTDQSQIATGGTYLSTEYDSEYIHDNQESEVTYWYRFDTYNASNEKTGSFITSNKAESSSLLDFFILDYGQLA